MVDRVSPSAPERSIRPMTREQVRERELYQQAQRKAAEQLADLEMRVDMDPYLKDDPLARLGFDPERIDWFSSPVGTLSAFYAPEGVDLGKQGLHPSTLSAYDLMYPDRQYKVPEDTIVINPTRPPASLAHEARHRGIKMLRRAGRDVDPMSYRYEEALVELGDVPFLEETSNLPRSNTAFAAGYRETRPLSWGHEYPDPGEGVRRYEKVLQELAQDELVRRGEPPRFVQPEPPQTGGVRELLRSIFGGN